MSRRGRALYLIVIAAGAWAAWNGVGYVMMPPTRYRAESAWFLFVAVLLLWAVMTRDARPGPGVAMPPVLVRRYTAALCLMVLIAIAVALYSPVLSIGLLSDDFVLLHRARSGALLDRNWEYVRPFPLAIWQLADRVVPPPSLPVAIHVLNVVVHGINAWLVGICANLLGLSRAPSAFAALLFLSSPLGVEPVAWSSGIFDVILTACVLTAAGAILAPHLPLSFQIGMVALSTLIAIASKETAVAMPLLLAAVAPLVGADRRPAAAVAVLSAAAIVGAYVMWRLATGVDAAPLLPASGYALKELLSRPFGTLGLPLHIGVLPAFPVVAMILAVFWPAAFVRSARGWPRDRRAMEVILLAAIWVLVSIVPLAAMFFVGQDLQGSRYLYLASAFWSIAAVVLVAGVAGRHSVLSIAVLVALVAGSLAAAVAHQAPWITASLERDKVLAAFAGVTSRCSVATVADLPDNVAGAYIFRNGFAEATGVPVDHQSGEANRCAVRWTGKGFSIER